MLSIQEQHQRVEQRLLMAPVAWGPRMKWWSSQEEFKRTIARNDQGYYLYLNAAVAELRPKTIVELGTCQGGSTLFMLFAADQDATLTSVDLGGRRPEYLQEVIRDPRLKLIKGDSCDQAIVQQLRGAPIDLLFIDTDHTHAQAKKEWAAYSPLMAPGAIVMMDDIHMNDMGRFWESLPNDKLDTQSKYHATGFGLFIAGYAMGTCAKVVGRHSPDEAQARGPRVRSNL